LKAIADTGFLVAIANRRDQYHDWAVNLLAELQTPLLTSEAVLSETAFHLQSSRTALLMVESGLVRIAINPEREWPELLRLAEQFDDQRPDLADLCVIRLSEIYPIHKVLTVDGSDFRVYRRNSREPIPVVCPAD
jgi:predicted nucleic acid-binding protein